MSVNLLALTVAIEFAAHFFAAGAIILVCDGGDSFMSEIGAWFLGLSTFLIVGGIAGRSAIYLCEMVGVMV